MPKTSQYEEDQDEDLEDDGDEAGGEEEEEEDRGDNVDDDGDGDQDGDDTDGDEDEDGEGDEDEGDGDGDGEQPDAETLRRIAGDDDVVPRARLNEVLDQNRKLVDAVLGGAGNRAAPAADEPKPFDLKAKLKERNAKLLEGDEDAALAIDLEIETNRQEVANQSAEKRALQIVEQREVSRVVTEVQKLYPELNDAEGNKAFDQDTLDEVIALRNVYTTRGKPLAEALRMAADRICGRNKPAPRGDAKGDPKGDASRDADERNGKRNPKAVKRLAKAVRDTPPRPQSGGVGERQRQNRGTDLDPETMSSGRFRNLSDTQKRDMRGDKV